MNTRSFEIRACDLWDCNAY